MKNVLMYLTFALCFAGCKKTGSEQTEKALSKKSPQAHASAADFTIVLLPDTQYYTDPASGHNGTLDMLVKQIDWIRNNQAPSLENIVYVGGLGDIVDNANDASQWTNASNQLKRLSVATPQSPLWGIPYGLSVGNHDQYPNGDPAGSSTSGYNGKFGRTEFHNRAYYGGNYAGTGSNNNDSHYDLFTASGIDFIVIHVEYDDSAVHGTALNNWVDGLLATYSSRKAIIITHYMVSSPNANFGPQGQLLYDKIKARTNVFMMYGGHVTDRASKAYTYNGNTIMAYLCDYQMEANGGEGYMRILKFKPDQNVIETKSYSPYKNLYKTAADEQFTHQMFTVPHVFPVTVSSIEDAHVRDGSYGGVNYGTAVNIAQKSSPTVGSSYKTYIKFDVTAITSPIKSAKLRVYGNVPELAGTTGTALINCYGSADTWTEPAITWNTAPPTLTSLLSSAWMNSLMKYHEFDVTSFVQTQAAGDNIVTIQLNQSPNQNKLAMLFSKENSDTAKRPELLIYH